MTLGARASTGRPSVEQSTERDPDRTRLAILKDDLPLLGAPASPDYLAEVLEAHGFRTLFLNCDEMADPSVLRRDNFELLVLPYGPTFPVQAADPFRHFLQQGGKFLSMGGYAFDNLVERTSAGWVRPGPSPSSDTDLAQWHCALPAEELRGRGPLTFSGWLNTAGVTGPGMAFFAVYQIAQDGSLPEWKDICRVTGSQDWQEQDYTFNVHPRATTVDLRAGLFRCRGTACFDDLRLVDATGNVLLQSDFEGMFDPDARGARCWSRSHSELCEVQEQTQHTGRRALKVRLDYEVPREERLNTRHGIPGDGLQVEAGQLGVFQADYPLERVRSARASPEQCVMDEGLRIDGPLEGPAACGMLGFNQARWIPLLETQDAYGRPRGAAGALLRHYAGPYAGSSWAFFGVTNRNLFTESEPGMASALAATVRSLVDDTYLSALIPGEACYRSGEEVELLATLFNGSRRNSGVRLEVEVFAGEPPSPSQPDRRRFLTQLSASVALEPGQTNGVRLRWRPAQLEGGFCHVVGRLLVDNRVVDRLESGFVVANPEAVATGPKLSYRDNYLHVGNRPRFLFGTDDWGYVFNTASETPLQWLRDMRQRRDLGVDIYENLQFGLPGSPAEQERLLRKVDGLVQLAQENDQVYFPCLLCGYNVAVSDADLARQQEYCAVFARRYADVPGLIYYLNGDLRCRLSDAVAPEWNRFLRERYGTTERLQQAWGEQAPKAALGEIPSEDYDDWGHAWDDVKVRDQNLFRAHLIRRWSGAMTAGLRRFDATHPTTAEFYQLPHQGVDIPAAIDGLDLANFGYFEQPGTDLLRFPAIAKFNDQRARGKSFGPGEYGVKTHPAWGEGQDLGYHTMRTREQAIELFLGIAHYSLGLGASRIQNWCWKDDANRVFPWGMIHPCDSVPKDTAYVHRNQSLLFRQFAPVYEVPSVHVLTADNHRFGGGKWQVIEGILEGFNLALANHVENLGTLNESDLRIPRQARVIFYPLPFCPPDEVCHQLGTWVRAGGVLYLSGDISLDELGRRTREQRLEDLCGVRLETEIRPNINLEPMSAADQPCLRVSALTARVLQQSDDGTPLLVENRLGNGRVFFSVDPIELHSVPERRDRDLATYRRVLQAAGIDPLGLVPDNPRVLLFKLPLQDGGTVHVLFNTDGSEPSQTVTLTDLQPAVTLQVAANRPALLWHDGTGALRAVEAQGRCSIGDQVVLEDQTGGILLTLDRRGIGQSRAMVLMPLQPGEIRLSPATDWKEAILETGEIRDGRWYALETKAQRSDEPTLGVRVTPDQALSLLLLTETDGLECGRRAITGMMAADH
ncbi:MAG: hypothetical protein H7A46_20270 [Verrucomicrobiales bacterium]|nr:hypothetical protein [Verrucomicrobiales bacterium]